MTRLKKRIVNIYSIYSPELDDYPYAPFTAHSNFEAVGKFTNFCLDKKRVCNNPQLRLIGKACLDSNGKICTVHPLMQVFVIDLNSKESKFIEQSVVQMRKAGESLNRFFLGLSIYLTDIKKTYLQFCQKIMKG